MTGSEPAAHGSVVIPAFNEGRVIDRCLRELADQGDLLIVVAANGCVDDTVPRARAWGVNVVELRHASKVDALNAGDACAGDAMPRVYLDADIELENGAIEQLMSVLLHDEEPRVAMPRLHWNLDGSSRLVRSFYRIYTRMPYMQDGLVGAGCYAVNAAGRRLWDGFPQITADDLFVQGLFEPAQRFQVEAGCVARAPRTVAGLLAVRTRTYLGNEEARAAGLAGSMHRSAARSRPALVRLMLSGPVAMIDGLVYATINSVAKLRARRRSKRLAGVWLTDTSTR